MSDQLQNLQSKVQRLQNHINKIEHDNHELNIIIDVYENFVERNTKSSIIDEEVYEALLNIKAARKLRKRVKTEFKEEDHDVALSHPTESMSSRPESFTYETVVPESELQDDLTEKIPGLDIYLDDNNQVKIEDHSNMNENYEPANKKSRLEESEIADFILASKNNWILQGSEFQSSEADAGFNINSSSSHRKAQNTRPKIDPLSEIFFELSASTRNKAKVQEIFYSKIKNNCIRS